MSFPDLCARLEQSFDATAGLLGEMLQGLQARRAAWSRGAADAVVPSPGLEQVAQQLAREEALRADLLADIRRVLPAPLGAAAAAMHVNVTRIAAALPTAAARSLRAAADRATAQAKAVRVEVTLGQRLLQFAQRAHAGLLAGAAGDAGATGAGAGAAVYDRHARTAPASGPRRERGAIVDGRI
ncbi:MAG: hypothetical protein KF830_11080 [Planctomycetes bacterium]|nr:hypothetical protein [Planctomycetota bacterium]